jgi:energy-coupling factor transporter ATP-binding protein EcfA2
VVILITHDREVAARAKRIIEIRDGLIISDSAADSRRAPPATCRPWTCASAWPTAPATTAPGKANCSSAAGRLAGDVDQPLPHR